MNSKAEELGVILSGLPDQFRQDAAKIAQAFAQAERQRAESRKAILDACDDLRDAVIAQLNAVKRMADS